MIGAILLALSWILLRLEGKGLGVLGLDAPVLRLRQFGAGFLVAGLAVVMQQLGHAAVAEVPWRLNPAADAALLLRGVRWNVNSVLYEELLFRGYLLYQAIRRLGARRAVLLAAAAFGVYHQHCLRSARTESTPARWDFWHSGWHMQMLGAIRTDRPARALA